MSTAHDVPRSAGSFRPFLSRGLGILGATALVLTVARCCGGKLSGGNVVTYSVTGTVQ